MTDATDRLALPLLAAGQAQKEMAHNEALFRLDMLVQPSVVAMGLDAPPADPEPGECWVIGETPVGDWAGHAQAVAGWTAGGWRFVAAAPGLTVWNRVDASFATFRDGAWRGGDVRAARLTIEGRQVVGPQTAAIAAPAGGAVADEAAREAIGAILGALRAHGLIAS